MDRAAAAATTARTLRYTSARSTLEVSFPVPGLAHELCIGKADLEGAQFLVRALETAFLPSGRILVFGDWERLEGYDLAGKDVVTEWTSKNRNRIAAIHLLVRSPIVFMAVSVSNLFTGVETVAYQRREAFEKAYKAAIIAARKPSPTE